MAERAKQQKLGLPPPAIPEDAFVSLEAARNALDKFQDEHLANLGHQSEPLTEAKEQLADLECSLGTSPASQTSRPKRQGCADPSYLNQMFPDAVGEI